MDQLKRVFGLALFAGGGLLDPAAVNRSVVFIVTAGASEEGVLHLGVDL
jgi:hypothetical protein